MHFFYHICKGNQLAGCILQLRVIGGVPKHLIERKWVVRRQLLCLIYCSISDLARRHVDDAPRAQVIGGVVDHTEIGQHVLHLGAIKEFHAAHHLIRHTVALERIFQGVGLGVHPIEHGVLPPVHTSIIGHHDLAHYIVCFIALVEGSLDGHLIAPAVFRPQGLTLAAHVVTDHSVGCIQNILSRAIVLLQADGPGAAVLLFKA